MNQQVIREYDGSMAYVGKVLSHDRNSNVGLIKPKGSSEGVLFLVGDVQTPLESDKDLVGKEVSFDIVRTEQGIVAVNIRLLRNRFARPGDWLAAIVAPLLVAAATYGFSAHFGWITLVSYIVAVNTVAFLLVVCKGSAPITYGTSPSDISLCLLALCGGAAATFVGAVLVPTRWQNDAARFGLLALVIAHGFVVHAIQPELFSRDAVKQMLHR